jgi:hypothetical protein
LGDILVFTEYMLLNQETIKNKNTIIFRELTLKHDQLVKNLDCFDSFGFFEIFRSHFGGQSLDRNLNQKRPYI